jgi:hypothetical protein
MTEWERLGIGGPSQGFLSARLSPSAALDDALAGIAAGGRRHRGPDEITRVRLGHYDSAPKRGGDLRPVALLGKGQPEQAELAILARVVPPG